MTNDEILARWQGWTDIWQGNTALVGTAPHNAVQEEVPDYPNDDAACGSLLDTLVEKGYGCKLITLKYPDYHEKEYSYNCTVWRLASKVDAYQPTRREAIVAACLEVARKEAQGE